MADHTVSAPGNDPSTSTELRVIFCPHGYNYWELEGTRAQLEAEGVIPPDTSWPNGTRGQFWHSGHFNYFMSRVRPPGATGSLKSWATADWWRLRCSSSYGMSHAQWMVTRAKRALEEAIYQYSPEAQRRRGAQFDRYTEAAKDLAFQAFKARVPALAPPPRKAKAAKANLGRAA